MAQLRFEALKRLDDRTKVKVEVPDVNISNFFGENVFGMEELRKNLAAPVYKQVASPIRNHEKIDSATADAVAAAVKIWAMSKGATHFTHWFQPMTGGTAEKHDSFFDALAGIEKFKGGPVGLTTISTAVGEEAGTIEEVYEPFLIQEGYLQRTARGREATALAFKHLGKLDHRYPGGNTLL